MSLKKYRAVIFDWDGTIMDSAARIVECLRKADQKAGLPELSDEKYRSIIGLSLRQAIEALHPDAPSELIDISEAEYRIQFLEKCDLQSVPFEGMTELLDNIEATGTPMAIATGKSRAGLNKVLSDDETGYGKYFFTTKSGEETACKPDPKMLQEIMDESGIALEHCLMVGDSEFDLKMANAIGMDSLAVSYGVHSDESLLSHNPQVLVHSPAEMWEWLSKRLAD